MGGLVGVLCAWLNVCWKRAARPRSVLLEGQIEPRTLSFKVADVERGFMKKRQAQLETAILVGAVVSFVFAALTLFVWSPGGDMSSTTDREQLEAVKRIRAIVQSSVLGVLLAALCALLLLSRWGTIDVCALEFGTFCSVAAWQAVRFTNRRYYIARLCGVADPSELWGMQLAGEDTNLIMWNCMGLVAVHALVPIRWKLVVPFGVVSFLAYVLPALLLGSPSAKIGVDNAAPLVGIVLFVCVGKRFDEIKDRELHWALLREKTLRCQAEFALEGSGCLRDPPRPAADAPPSIASDDLASTARAAPSTTPTAALFQGAGEDGAVSLEALAELGRKEQWLIEADQVTMSARGQLGQGGFGVVTEGVYQGVAVAVKSPKADMYGAVRGVTRRELCNELCILRRLRHPNIVFLYGAVLKFDGAFELMLVLELIRGSTLRDYLCPASPIPDTTRLQLMLHVSSAVAFLHARQPTIVHGDLKAENVFVEAREEGGPRAKLLDFGLSRMVTRRARPPGGTLRWMAPEVMTGERAPNPAADVFSFGRVVYFAATGLLPFHNVRGERLEQSLRRSPKLSWPRASAEGDLARACQAIVEDCTQAEPAARPSMPEVLSSLSTAMDTVQVAGGHAAGGCAAGSAPAARRAPKAHESCAKLAPVLENAVHATATGSSAATRVPTQTASSTYPLAPEDQEEQELTDVIEASGVLTYRDFQEAVRDIEATARRQCSDACLERAQDIIAYASTLGKRSSESPEELVGILSEMVQLLQTIDIDPYLPVNTSCEEEMPGEGMVQECSDSP